MFEIELNASNLISFLVVAMAVTVAAITDIKSLKVYNLLTFPLIIGGLLFHAILPGGQGFGFAFGGAALGFALLFLPFVAGGIGAGDLKLMTGIGAWLGASLTFGVFLASGVAVGVYAIVVMFTRGSVRDTLSRIQVILLGAVCRSGNSGGEERVEDLVHRTDCRARLIPFAAVICFATLCLLVVVVAQG